MGVRTLLHVARPRHQIICAFIIIVAQALTGGWSILISMLFSRTRKKFRTEESHEKSAPGLKPSHKNAPEVHKMHLWGVGYNDRERA